MRFSRIAVVILCLLCAVMLFSCGEKACEHPEESLTFVNEVLPTCLETGYTEKLCGLCGETVNFAVSELGHDYAEEYDIKIGADRTTCSRCDDNYLTAPAGGKLRLTGYVAGDAVFSVSSPSDGQEIELLVDGASVTSTTCAAGVKYNFVAKDIEEGQQTFELVNAGSEDICSREVSMDGMFNRPGSVLLHVMKSGNGEHAAFKIYIQTSDPSGDYYVCYDMGLDNNDDRNVYKADSTRNVYNYRIKEARLVKVSSITETNIISSTVISVLQQGEKSLALKHKVTDRSVLTEEAATLLGGGDMSVDFVGGYHGDEWMEDVLLFADGEKVELLSRKDEIVIPCSAVAFNQTSTMYQWGTSSADSHGKELAFHAQNFIMDSNGIRNTQSITWMDDNLEFGSVMMLMFTMLRESGGKPVCEIVETYDAEGNFLDKYVSKYPCSEDQKSHLQNVANHTVKYSSETSGISAMASFEAVDDSIKTHNSYVWVRQYGDNKLYCDFASATKGKKADSGDVWAIKTHYTIDYVKPE